MWYFENFLWLVFFILQWYSWIHSKIEEKKTPDTFTQSIHTFCSHHYFFNFLLLYPLFLVLPAQSALVHYTTSKFLCVKISADCFSGRRLIVDILPALDINVWFKKETAYFLYAWWGILFLVYFIVSRTICHYQNNV